MKLRRVHAVYKGTFSFPKGMKIDLFNACKELTKKGINAKYSPETGFYQLGVKTEHFSLNIFEKGDVVIIRNHKTIAELKTFLTELFENELRCFLK